MPLWPIPHNLSRSHRKNTSIYIKRQLSARPQKNSVLIIELSPAGLKLQAGSGTTNCTSLRRCRRVRQFTRAQSESQNTPYHALNARSVSGEREHNKTAHYSNEMGTRSVHVYMRSIQSARRYWYKWSFNALPIIVSMLINLIQSIWYANEVVSYECDRRSLYRQCVLVIIYLIRCYSSRSLCSNQSEPIR